jgi:hypothetical protein
VALAADDDELSNKQELVAPRRERSNGTFRLETVVGGHLFLQRPESAAVALQLVLAALPTELN